MINSWTGKLKVNKLQLSKILKCESHIDDISKELSKPIPNDIDFSQRVDEGVTNLKFKIQKELFFKYFLLFFV